MAVLINTAAVSLTADDIDKVNKKIRDELSEVDLAVRELRSNWTGQAADSCASKYGRIKDSFSDRRYSVVNGMVVFMKNSVGESYNAAEQTLVNAASAFK